MIPKIGKKQTVWLLNHGDRTVNDLLGDKNGLYVPMTNDDGEEVKVYLPDEQDLILGSYVGGYYYVERKVEKLGK